MKQLLLISSYKYLLEPPYQTEFCEGLTELLEGKSPTIKDHAEVNEALHYLDTANLTTPSCLLTIPQREIQDSWRFNVKDKDRYHKTSLGIVPTNLPENCSLAGLKFAPITRVNKETLRAVYSNARNHLKNHPTWSFPRDRWLEYLVEVMAIFGKSGKLMCN